MKKLLIILGIVIVVAGGITLYVSIRHGGSAVINNPLPSGGDETVSSTDTVTLAVGEEGSIDNLKVKLLSIENDSRCPLGVVCIWAGEVTAKVMLTEMTGSSTLLIHSTASTSSIRIASVFPIRQASTTIAQADYRITFELNPDAVAQTSGIQGIALVGPQCPVVQAGEECPDRPLSIKLIITDSRGRTYTTTSNSSGSFKTVLPPGIYKITKDDETKYPVLAPTSVTVKENSFTAVNLSFDSGIR